MWYKNAVIYCLDVETFMDSDGDGIGDFQGAIDRIDHLENLGVTCVWLQPFYPSPNRDDGYDVVDYYNVDRRLGTLGTFTEFSHQLKERGIRLILDLVLNHTSDQHPWFQEACRDPNSRYRDFYIWSKDKPTNADQGMVFPGVQDSVWTWNEEAGAYYYHRFFRHQPDLNIANPEVRQEILRILGFWIQLGVSGFRVDAAPFLVELVGHDDPRQEAMYGFLREMREFLAWRSAGSMLLGEANVAPDKLSEYFGDGNRMQALFNFIVNQSLFLALARQHARPLADALKALPKIPRAAQWVEFLRNHDELDLGRLSEEERQEVFAAFGPDPDMQIFGRGIRRRLAPMFGNNLRRVELAHSLILSLPGSQVIRYGDEIGMGDDLTLEGRKAVRTVMQWSDAQNAGFSNAPASDLVRPALSGGEYGCERVNVQAQIQDPESLLNRMQRLVRARKSCPEIGWGDGELVETDQPSVLAYRAHWDGRTVLTLHNLAEAECQVRLKCDPSERRPVNLVGDRAYDPPGETFDLAGYGYRWFRL